MKSYACYVHVPGVPTPHLRFVGAENREFRDALRAMAREWPRFELIDVCDEEDRPLVRLTQADRPRLAR